jgi:CBS domain containing-hemolysin-like protein
MCSAPQLIILVFAAIAATVTMQRHKHESLNQSGASTGENHATLVQGMNHRLKEVQSSGLLANLAAGLVTGIIAVTVSTAFAADKLKEMENKSPQIAYAFHKFIIGILGERLTDTNETLKALIG